MEIVERKTIKITPHKSIYKKMGSSSHGFNESIAELIDNSIDAMIGEQREGKYPLMVFVIVRNDKIKVIDTAGGMSEEKAAKTIVLGESTKGNGDLGRFGFGLKTAAFSIGKRLHVKTGLKGEPVWYQLTFDEDEWENNPDYSWDSFPFFENKKSVEDHGTITEIEKLKIKGAASRVTSLKRDIGKRYRGFIKRGNLVIFVNKQKCKPEKVEWSDGWPEKFELETEFGKIYGIVGLMKEGSQKGLYGFDLFKNGRMIRSFEKFAIPEHPTVARIFGEVHLDFVPVTHEKNKFIEESEEYENAVRVCRESEIFKKVVREARKKAVTHDTITKSVKEKTDIWQDHLAKTFRDPEIKSLTSPNVKSKESKGDEIEKEGDEREMVEVEKRDGRNDPEIVEHKPPITTKKRIPKETHEALRHMVTINGKVFKFKHEWIHDPGLERKDWGIDENEGILVYTNTAFPAWQATSDQPFYTVFNIIEAIAEVYGKESGVGIDKINEVKDLILRRASEFKNQFKEEEKI